MQIKVLFDKEALNDKLHSGWGVSFLIDDKILFDTGENGAWLIHNMRFSGVNIDKIEGIVISHDHWDHTGGLWEVLKEKKGLPVYSCPGFSPDFKKKVGAAKAVLVETEAFMEILPDIYVTGEIPGTYNSKYMPEQALVLKTKKGINIITGCAHPGIIKIVDKIRNRFPGDTVYLVLGGFHLMNEDERAVKEIASDLKKRKITKAGPTHCSGEVAEKIFKDTYKINFLPIKAGQEIAV